MANLNQNSPLHLADEIVHTPAEALLGEVTEDLGDRRALANEFDSVVARALRHSRPKQLTTAMKNGGVWLSQRLFSKPLLVSVGTLAALLIAVVGYRHYDQPSAVSSIESLNLPVGSPQQPRLASSDDAAGGGSAPAKVPASQLASLQTQSDVQKALAAYETARAYQARDRAAQAFDRGDYPAAIASFNEALRSCDDRCQPELRGALGSDLERAQNALRTVPAAVLAAAPPPAVHAAPVAGIAAPAQSSPALAWPVKGRITVSFGARTTALADPHAPVQTAEGIAIAVPEGTDIRAAADGIVSSVDNDKRRGKFLQIRHADDLTTGYGGVRRVLVKGADQVHRGEVIAKGVVGSRGAQPQLYFEVRRGTAPVDPMQYLPPER